MLRRGATISLVQSTKRIAFGISVSACAIDSSPTISHRHSPLHPEENMTHHTTTARTQIDLHVSWRMAIVFHLSFQGSTPSIRKPPFISQMPQHGINEDPTTVLPHLFARPMSATNEHLKACYVESINRASNTDTPMMRGSGPLAPSHFHRRHSTVSRDDWPLEDHPPVFLSQEPALNDPSLKRLTESEKKQLAETEAWQKQEDDIQRILHSSRRARERAATDLFVWGRNAELEEAPMPNGYAYEPSKLSRCKSAPDCLMGRP